MPAKWLEIVYMRKCIINGNIHPIYGSILPKMTGLERTIAFLTKIMDFSIAEGGPGP